MFEGAFAPDGVVADLRTIGGAVGQLDPASIDGASAADVLAGLATLADQVGGAIARFSAAVAESAVWASSGATSPAAGVARLTGMGLGRARAAIELGDALSEVPALDDAIRSGALSPAAAAAVVPAVDDDGFDDAAEELIAELSGMAPAAAHRHVETWRTVANADDDAQRRRSAREARCLKFRPVGDGMTEVSGILPNDTVRTLRRALAHLSDQQRLDGSERTRQQRTVDALGDLAAAYNRGEVRGGRNLPRVIVSMTLDDLVSRHPTATDTLTGETLTSAEIDQLCCDAVIHRDVADQTGARLNFGRGRRTASPNQFLAMVARDRGCRHPACDRPPQWCEAHHLREFAARGGLTDIDEMVLLCHHHHHALHDGGWKLTGDPTHLIFTGPDGRQLHSSLGPPCSLPRHDTKDAAA